MRRIRSVIAISCALMMVVPVSAQDPGGTSPSMSMNGGFLSRFTRPYSPQFIPPINLQNSGRLDSLLRGGTIYLSLQDAIALALENNLDIELSRYGPKMADVDLLRARAGGLLRGVPTAVQTGPSSALNQAAGGATGATGGQAFASGGGGGGGAGGTVITQTGAVIPNLDPVFFTSYNWGHRTRPFSNTVTTGTTSLVSDAHSFNSGYQQGFLTGTTISFGFNNDFVRSNNIRSDINPLTNSSFQLQLSQRLLQGFGLAVNSRNIRIARNEMRISDVVFKAQVITTVTAIINLYWDLLSFSEDAKVKRQALQVAEKFYEDNKKQVEIGTLAPIEIVRAEARVAQAQQDLTNSETQLFQQETLLKNALSRTGVASPSVADARVIPTDRFVIPERELVEPVQDLIARAMESRPEIQQVDIEIENTRIGIAGSRSQLLPSLDFQATFQNNALSGMANELQRNGFGGGADPFFIGGYGTALAQLFRRNFPDYAFGFQMNIPIKNRQAQADYVRDQLQLRQQELRQQRQLNQIRVDVHNALIGLNQARARYQSAVKERVLQEQTLDAEQKKYALGASTAFQVIQTQRDLAQAQAAEVAALTAYSRARNQLDFATGEILAKYGIEIQEAREGRVSRASNPVVPAQ